MSMPSRDEGAAADPPAATTVINPSGAAAFGASNVIMTGRARRHHVPPFVGALSLKGVLRGEAEWLTPDGAHVVRPDALLTLNDGQSYSLTIDSREETETFCVFFRRGLVESAANVARTTDDQLLDRETATAFGFWESLQSSADEVGHAWRGLSRIARRAAHAELDWAVEALAAALARRGLSDRDAPQRLAAAKPATREEISRRVRRAQAALEGDLTADWRLDDLAAVAAMAPHHFHRCFRQLFGETPRAYMARRRFERASELLRAFPEVSVTEACLAVGYSSLGAFSRTFRRRFGAPPSVRAPSPDEA